MIAYLSKSDASEGFNQIIDFLNRNSIKYALTVNPNIYVSCIKQFWTSIAVKKVNDVMRLQALVDKKKKVIISEATIRDALRLDDAEGIECLANEEIFADTADDEVPTAVKEPSIPSPTPPPQPLQDQPSTSQDAGLPMDLLQNLMDTCTTLTRRVENLEHDKIAQALDITKLKSRVKKLERRRLAQHKELTPQMTLLWMMYPNRGIIANIDADKDVVLEDAKEVVIEKSTDVDESADIQERKAEYQAEIYKIDMEHAKKIITEVVTAASDTITAASTTITAADVPIPAATIAAAPTLTAAPKEPKPLKKQAQIEQDEKYARELEAELNKNIDWDEVIDHVQRKQKEDKVVKRYQALKRKPQTEAQARKNMMLYLKNVAGFKMDYFKGMTYDDIRPIFEKHFNFN
nr:hypothetical protein [Tanacetum cinerariifolium]